MENKEEKKEPIIKKKRQSGKRKPKEHVSSKPVVKEEIVVSDTPEVADVELKVQYLDPAEEIAKMVDQVIINELINEPKELSKQAENWRLWLERYKLTPEQFLEKYPNHKFKHFMEEIIAFQAKK